MNVKAITVALVCIMVGAVIFGSIIPIFQDISDSQKTVYNNPTTQLSVVANDNYVVEIDVSNMTVSINGVDVTPTGNTAIIMSESYNVLFQKSDNQIHLYSEDKTTGYTSLTGIVNISIDGKDSVIEYGPEDSRVTEEYTNNWAYIMDSKGTYGLYRLYNQNKTLYVNSIDDIHGSNILVTTSDWFSYSGDDVTLKSGGVVTTTYTLTPVSGYDDLYTISVGGTGTGYTFEVDNAGTPYTVHPWMVVAPISVIGVKENTGPTMSILEILPLVLGAGLVLMAIGLFVSRKF